jgi:taurine transport system permease protein
MFGYGFGAISFIIFNAGFLIVTCNTLLGVSPIPREMRNAVHRRISAHSYRAHRR